MNNRLTESNFFYALRGLAIISVAYAHSLSLSTDVLQRIGEAIGIIGVPLFMVSSGYYFKYESWNTLATKLTEGIISPWLIWGTIAFAISSLLGAVSNNLSSFIAFIIGHGTWLYYIPVYIIIRCIFNCHATNSFLYGTILLSIVSNIVSFYLPGKLAPISSWCTPWQNPFNWCGFFAVGILIRRLELFTLLCNNHRIAKTLLSALSLIIFVLLIAIPWKINYWNPIAVIFEYLIVFALLGLTGLSQNRFLRVLGKNSLLIYLLHIQLGIASANIIFRFLHFPEIIVLMVKPLTVLAITMLLIIIIREIVCLMRLNRYCKYLGLFDNYSK